MNKFTLWFRKHTWLTGMVLSQSRELTDLRKQIEHKNLCLQRSQTDYADARSFYTAQNKILNDRVTELSAECERWYTRFFGIVQKSENIETKPSEEISFTNEKGERFVAEIYQSKERQAIDVFMYNEYQDVYKLASVEYEKKDCPYTDYAGQTRIRTYNNDNIINIETVWCEPKH